MKRLPLPLCVLLLFLLPSLLAAQLPLGPQFQVSVHRQLSATSPQVAINASGSFVALWYGPGDLTGGVLRARRFEADGEPATGEIGIAGQVQNTGENLAVALQDDGSFLVLFSSPIALKLLRFGPDGTLLLDEQVASGSPSVPTASLSRGPDGRFVVGWSLFDGTVSARVFSPDGLPLGPTIAVAKVSDGDYGFGPWVAMGSGGEFVVAWSTVASRADPSGTVPGSIQARRYGAGSHPRGAEILVSDHFSARVHVGKNSAGSFLVTWVDVPTSTSVVLYGRRFSAAGIPFSAAIPLIPHFTLENSAVAMAPDGSLVVAWDGYSVFGQVFAPDGVPPRPIFLVPQLATGNQADPQVAINGMGRFVVVWQDDNTRISGRRFKARRP